MSDHPPCQCGCGGTVRLAHHRFLHGHAAVKKVGPAYVEEDRGYETPCWVWQRALHSDGYGECYDPNGRGLAHRVYYERKNGPVPAGMDLDHLCRVRPCVNPAHLEAVSHAENVRRGRLAKLTPQDAQEIRDAKGARGWRELAEQFGVSRSAIYAVWSGRTWA